MKITFFGIFGILLLSISSSMGQRLSALSAPLDTATINKVEFIAIIEVSDLDGNKVLQEVVANFKGHLWQLRNFGNLEDLEIGGSYLIFANIDESAQHSPMVRGRVMGLINSDSRVIKKEDSVPDIDLLLYYLPCKDENLQSHPCARNLDEVCGCNKITYGNECEARNAKVVIWRKGACDKEKYKLRW